MISVIMTSFNRGEKIRRAIQSVIEQSFKEWELIIVDDHSTDGVTKPIIQEYAAQDSRIKPIFRDTNFGHHTRPKNEGTLAAQYDYIAYLDDDNAYRKDHLQALWKAMERHQVDVVYGDRMVVDESGKKPQLPGVSSDFSLGLLGKRNYIDTSDVLCRKAAILSVGGWNEELRFYADWNLWVRMAKNGSSFVHLPLVITDYYVHGGNNLSKKYEEFTDQKKMMQWLNDNIQNTYLWPDKTIVGTRPDLKVAVFTLTYERLDYTIETFKSMRETTKYPFDHFVLDQASQDQTRKWLADNEKEMSLKLELSDHNLGISKGSNVLLDRIFAEGDYDIIIKVDNDCKFLSEGWLEVMVDCFQRGRGFILAPYPEGLIDHPGGAPRIRDGFLNTHYVGITQHLGGICIAAPKGCYTSFRWPTEDFLHGEQDWVFSQEMRKRGFVMMYLENIRIEHIDSTTGQHEKYPEYFERRKEEKVKRYEPTKA